MKQLEQVVIYVVTHKPVKIILPECYKKIAVGTFANSKAQIEYLHDNVQLNISEKNPNYCELTAHYWIWKNTENDIVGLCHYRRFFTKSIFSNSQNHILSEKDIHKIIPDNYDIILPFRPIARRKVKEIYCDYGYLKDWDILREVICDLEPEYVKEFDDLSGRHSNYPANMLICKKELFDAYSEWLFPILFEVEKRVDLKGYDKQELRIFGYMSERLLEVWVRKNQLKVKHYRILKTDQKYTVRTKMIELVGILLNPIKY